jgi:hypothetical protein
VDNYHQKKEAKWKTIARYNVIPEMRKASAKGNNLKTVSTKKEDESRSIVRSNEIMACSCHDYVMIMA